MTKPQAAAAVILLVFALAVPGTASPPYVTSEYAYDEIGEYTQFAYRIEALSYSYMITGFDVYAPMDYTLLEPIFGAANGVRWYGTATQDSPGVAKIRWMPETADGYLFYGDSVRVMLNVFVPVVARDNYTSPGYATNWGYETTSSAYTTGESTLLWVPEVVPEPSSLMALLVGGLGLALRKRR